jgi:hypothetical protein
MVSPMRSTTEWDEFTCPFTCSTSFSDEPLAAWMLSPIEEMAETASAVSPWISAI